MNLCTADSAAGSVNMVLSETLETPRPPHGILLQYGCHRGIIRMRNETAKRRDELYIVELDGVKNSEHRVFVEALKCGMELKIRHPRSKVKLRDADEHARIKGRHVAIRTWNIGRSLDDEYSAARPTRMWTRNDKSMGL
jgi:hypothetical protein